MAWISRLQLEELTVPHFSEIETGGTTEDQEKLDEIVR
jgi:hypothetical protein